MGPAPPAPKTLTAPRPAPASPPGPAVGPARPGRPRRLALGVGLAYGLAAGVPGAWGLWHELAVAHPRLVVLAEAGRVARGTVVRSGERRPGPWFSRDWSEVASPALADGATVLVGGRRSPGTGVELLCAPTGPDCAERAEVLGTLAAWPVTPAVVLPTLVLLVWPLAVALAATGGSRAVRVREARR